MKPEEGTNEMVVTSLHPGVTRELVRQQTSWGIRFVDTLEDTPPPTADELGILRDLHARTAKAHGRAAGNE
jgi:glutaconate CoA-transferase subunit B